MRTKLHDVCVVVFNPESVEGLLLRLWFLAALAGLFFVFGVTR